MEAGGWRLVVAVQCNLVVILIGIGHRLIHLCIILVCNSDMAVVLISHSDVNNTISNGLFYVKFGVENIYTNQKRNYLARKNVLVNMRTGCEKSLNFK